MQPPINISVKLGPFFLSSAIPTCTRVPAPGKTPRGTVVGRRCSSASTWPSHIRATASWALIHLHHQPTHTWPHHGWTEQCAEAMGVFFFLLLLLLLFSFPYVTRRLFLFIILFFFSFFVLYTEYKGLIPILGLSDPCIAHYSLLSISSRATAASLLQATDCPYLLTGLSSTPTAQARIMTGLPSSSGCVRTEFKRKKIKIIAFPSFQQLVRRIFIHALNYCGHGSRISVTARIRSL
ncbi:hypothetical protein IF1G_00542 [Cordyceps javanica]|uniref:Uncharacterized protein n=1 Tax=Cordyceps javanica TaxID=43265 RepID=A0A545VFY1_9HYPO|nr:hypothetical protein IF1G_00542 [Cordyceps javanica]